MAISFEQPDANAASPGALQAYLEAVRLTQHHNQGYGHGGGGGGPGFGGWGVQGLGGGGGGGHGGDGGVARDVVGEYAAMQGIDAQTREDERNRATAWLRQNTAGQQSPEEIARTQELQDRQRRSTQSFDEAFHNQETDAQGQQQPVEFSTADQRELDRLNQGAATIRQQLRDGFIDQATANNMNAQIHTQRNPLQIQQQAATTALTQQAVQRGNEAARLAAAHEATRIQVMAGASQQGIVNPRDPATGRDLGPHQWDDTHHRLVPMNDREQLNETHRAAAQNRQDRAETTERDRFDKVLSEVERTVLGRDSTAAPTPAQQASINRMMADRGFHVDDAEGARPDASYHMSAYGSMREDKPLTGPNARPTERQQQELSMFDASRQMANRVNAGAQEGSTWLPEQQARIRQAEQLYRQYGNIHAMRRAGVLNRYRDIIKEAEQQSRLSWATTNPQQQQAAPAPQRLPPTISTQPGDVATSLGGMS